MGDLSVIILAVRQEEQAIRSAPSIWKIIAFKMKYMEMLICQTF